MPATANAVLPLAEVQAHLQAHLPRWTVSDGAIRRVLRTGGWKGTLMAVNTIGHLAEVAWHHPELQVSYASVAIALNTHDAGGITAKDVALADKIESVLCWRPGAEAGAV
ncbi:MAG: 4a-hydroxytetrahydrobiopterin dehydratase, partial [Aquabacterium sp.]|nr:4a-hydroxytetrahydrobiopterin dehydratase [Aquabacterium sp.]